MMRKCFGFLKKTVIAVEQNLRFLFVELLPKERKKRKDILHPKVQPKLATQFSTTSLCGNIDFMMHFYHVVLKTKKNTLF